VLREEAVRLIQDARVGDDVALSSRALKVAATMVPAPGRQGDDDDTTGSPNSRGITRYAQQLTRYHQTLHDIKKRGIDVEGVKLNLQQMLKAKEDSVNGLTKGIGILFKQNKVDYIKGTASFVSPKIISVQLNDSGKSTVEAKNVIIATGSEVAPFPGGAIEIDEQQIISSTAHGSGEGAEGGEGEDAEKAAMTQRARARGQSGGDLGQEAVATATTQRRGRRGSGGSDDDEEGSGGGRGDAERAKCRRLQRRQRRRRRRGADDCSDDNADCSNKGADDNNNNADDSSEDDDDADGGDIVDSRDC
ncbi:hypothetical protein EDB84DRAFT_1439533, partial [Lactarius hengduanensis]